MELVGYSLGSMFGELLPIHVRIVNPVVATLPRLFFIREDPIIDHVVERARPASIAVLQKEIVARGIPAL